jgi:L-lactate dehydrogenase (cytochrome)
MDHLKRIGAQDKLEVYMDGGVRRGTDIFKALALGAKAVGIGRPFLFAMSSYGQIGVERAIQILKDEFEMVMRLMGVTRIDEIRPEMICTRNLPDHVVVPKDYLAHDIYDRMMPPKSRL